ncbi:MAG: DUF3325 domain-containing protein [Sphingomonas phyllosphaerae]|uniref:DUF3325 domain-containing protein n=1 Tax=Sphingomonas phyllosphaerae TaxID=257003 RepID=UPI002FFA3F99
MIHLSIFLLVLSGFVLILLSMARHRQDWLRSRPCPASSFALRIIGFGALTSAFAVAGAALGWAYGAVTWFGWLTMAAFLVVTLNTNRERILRKGRR